MAESEPVLPVSSACVRVAPLELLQSNRWEAGPPCARARSSTATCRPRQEGLNVPSAASHVCSGDLMKPWWKLGHQLGAMMKRRARRL